MKEVDGNAQKYSRGLGGPGKMPGKSYTIRGTIAAGGRPAHKEGRTADLGGGRVV